MYVRVCMCISVCVRVRMCVYVYVCVLGTGHPFTGRVDSQHPSPQLTYRPHYSYPHGVLSEQDLVVLLSSVPYALAASPSPPGPQAGLG